MARAPINQTPQSPWAAPSDAANGFRAPQAPMPWKPPMMSRREAGMEGVRRGSEFSGYIQGPGGVRPLKPGETGQMRPGETLVAGAPPGTVSRGDQIRDAALADRKNAIAAQKRQQGRFDAAIAGFNAEVGRADQDADRITSDIDKAMAGGKGDFDEAKQFWRDSVKGFEDRGAKDAAAFSAGANADLRQMENEIKNDPNLPDNVKAQRLHRLRMDAGANAQKTVTGIYSQVNERLASLRAGAGAGLGQIASAEAASNQNYIAMKDATLARAGQMRMQGRAAAADLLTRYPDSPISMVDTLLQMAGADQIPGANQSGFRF